MILNGELRSSIAKLVYRAREGHIPSSYSVIDIINHAYAKVLNYDIKDPNSPERDYFILSKGHSALALFVVLNKFGMLSDSELNNYGQPNSNLGGHPNKITTPFIESSTGSLGHGFPMAVGIALGMKILKKNNKTFALVGDGECQEGTIWEAANIASNQQLNNVCAIVDWNGSARQLMPIENLKEKWSAFGWEVVEIDGHSQQDLDQFINKKTLFDQSKPVVVIAKNVKGKGVSFLEGHGIWHHKIPNDQELAEILKELNDE